MLKFKEKANKKLTIEELSMKLVEKEIIAHITKIEIACALSSVDRLTKMTSSSIVGVRI
jgi:hypothetical protein